MVICIGGACIDRKYHLFESVRPQTSNPARVEQTYGGVAGNVAQNLARLGVPTALLSLIGNDANGQALRTHLDGAGVSTELLKTAAQGATSEYTAIIETGGDLLLGVSDFELLDAFSVRHLEAAWPQLCQAAWVFADCNISSQALEFLLTQKRDAAFRLAVDGVSEAKVCKLPHDLRGVEVLFVNQGEAAAYLQDHAHALSAESLAQALKARGAGTVVLTQGERGMLLADRQVVHVPAVHAQPVDATGAGDALIAGTLSRLVRGDSIAVALQTGALAAALTIESLQSVRGDLSLQLLERERREFRTV